MAETVADMTADDIGILIEAVEAWEHGDNSGELLGTIMGAMLIPKDSPERAEYDREIAQTKAENLAAARQRKERSVLIRAKLIGILDTKRAESLIGSVAK